MDGTDVSGLVGGKSLTVYWLMLLIPALAGLGPWKAKGILKDLQWIVYGLILIFIIGFRHQVGGDWETYNYDINLLHGVHFSDLMKYQLSNDVGYELISWFSVNYLNGIYTANLICAAIFVSGLLRVCKAMPIPWLALVVAIPYLVVVVSMGYTRQAAALGFIMLGLIELMNGKSFRFYVMIILASLFHKTAIFMLPIGFLYSHSLSNLKELSVFIFFFLLSFYAILLDRIAGLLQYYVTDTTMNSSGAFIRVGMNFIAALSFYYFRKSWNDVYKDNQLWTIFSVITFIMLPLTFLISTTIDRLALYLIPMQLVIFSRIPMLIICGYNKTLFVLSVVFLYIGALFVWLNYGAWSGAWLPYQNYLFK